MSSAFLLLLSVMHLVSSITVYCNQVKELNKLIRKIKFLGHMEIKQEMEVERKQLAQVIKNCRWGDLTDV